jgi:hypothetical protein
MRPRRNWRRALALALVAVARRKVAPGSLVCEPTVKGQPGRSGRRQGRQGRVSTTQQIRALSMRQLANYTRNPVCMCMQRLVYVCVCSACAESRQAAARRTRCHRMDT